MKAEKVMKAMFALRLVDALPTLFARNHALKTMD